jgi:hypothetical protein
MRSSSWKLKAGAGGLAVVGGIAGGLALTSHSTAIHDSAYDFGFGQNGYGAMLNSAMAGLQTHNSGLAQRSLQELSAIKGFGDSWNVVNHHQRSTVEFQRGRIVLITHHFLIVRGQGGKLTVWKLSGNTAVQDVAATITATAKPTVATATPTVATPTPSVSTPAAAVVTPTPTAPASIAAVPVTAAVPTLTTGTAAQAVTGGTPVTTMLNSTAAAAPSVTTISVTTGTTTITITITSHRDGRPDRQGDHPGDHDHPGHHHDHPGGQDHHDGRAHRGADLARAGRGRPRVRRRVGTPPRADR